MSITIYFKPNDLEIFDSKWRDLNFKIQDYKMKAIKHFFEEKGYETKLYANENATVTHELYVYFNEDQITSSEIELIKSLGARVINL